MEVKHFRELGKEDDKKQVDSYIQLHEIPRPLEETPASHNDGQPETVVGWYFPTRYIIGIMMLLSATCAYIMRAGFSLNLLAMINVYDENGTLIDQPDFGPRYDWSNYEQSLLLGAFHYAYPFALIPSGMLIDKFSLGRPFVFVAMLLAGIVMLLTPLAVSSGSFAVAFVMRMFIGFTLGGIFPNIHRLVSRWAPRSEVGLFMVANHGSNVGTVLAWVISGAIIESYGWQWSFYAVGIVIVGFLVLWWWTVYDSPARHPRIRPAERALIESSVPPLRSSSWPSLPRMLTSLPFWSLVLMQFGNDWGLYFVMTSVPKFLNQVLGFQIGSTGLLAAMPYAARVTSAVLFALLGDWVRARNWMSLIALRRVFSIFSHVVPALLLLAIPFWADAERPYTVIALMTSSFAFNGAVTMTSQSNFHDVAPKCAATVLAVVNSISSTSGFISPLVVAYFTNERNTIDEWRYVFITGATMYMLPAGIFAIFGSAVDQNWIPANTNM